MAYSGFLIKVGDYTIPSRLIKAKTYNVQLNRMDNDTYTDGDGVLHRNATKIVSPKIEFETIPSLGGYDVQTLLSNIRANIIDEDELKVICTVYIPTLDTYITQEAYFVEPKICVDYADNTEIWYQSFRIAFIGYGGRAQ